MKILLMGRDGCLSTSSIELALRDGGHELEVFLSASRNEDLPERVVNWSGDLILSFRNLVVLPASLLQRSRFAINFHPGPPEYPGSGCVNYALLEGAQSFGVTCHVMTQQVDSGRILEVRRFEIGETSNLLEVLEMTHSALTQLAFDFITTLKSSKMEDLESLLLDSEISEKWGGKRRKISHLDELLAVPLDISKHELDVRIRALHHPSFPLRVDLHGYKFELRTDEI